ncbi:peptidase inhibitor family I36 protein [Streptomyces sp. 796.1]|uniref:peptidase inhibitor family I36 protein n=1 Tax=Streptomyces sp. 796.1 TaxID=3163029 RepID=UPI0039C99AD5
MRTTTERDMTQDTRQNASQDPKRDATPSAPRTPSALQNGAYDTTRGASRTRSTHGTTGARGTRSRSTRRAVPLVRVALLGAAATAALLAPTAAAQQPVHPTAHHTGQTSPQPQRQTGPETGHQHSHPGDCAAGQLCLWERPGYAGHRHTFELADTDIESCVPLPAGARAASLANRTGRPVTTYQSAECGETGEFDTYPGKGGGVRLSESPYQIRAIKIWEH